LATGVTIHREVSERARRLRQEKKTEGVLMFLETILADAIHVEDEIRKSASAVAGTWRNRLGSTMELTVDSHHHLHGTFQLDTGGPNRSVSFQVVGFAEGDALSFCVDFGNRGSVASWAGHHLTDEAAGERLVTLWHLARPVKDPHGEADLTMAVMTGADEFVRIDA
jgi:hypothetical protein